MSRLKGVKKARKVGYFFSFKTFIDNWVSKLRSNSTVKACHIYFPLQLLLTKELSFAILLAICLCKSSFFSSSLLSSIRFKF